MILKETTTKEKPILILLDGGGLSFGAQIVIEVLSQRKEIATYPIIESALVYPIKGTATLTIPMYKLFYGLLKQRWFSKMQAKRLCVPTNMFERYYNDSLNISRQSLINITLSNGNYSLKRGIVDTRSKILVIVGEKEISIMRKSVQRLHDTINGSEIYVAPAMKYGDLSLVYTSQYIDLFKSFVIRKERYNENGF